MNLPKVVQEFMMAFSDQMMYLMPLSSSIISFIGQREVWPGWGGTPQMNNEIEVVVSIQHSHLLVNFHLGLG
jgi:hypothetical protein